MKPLVFLLSLASLAAMASPALATDLSALGSRSQLKQATAALEEQGAQVQQRKGGIIVEGSDLESLRQMGLEASVAFPVRLAQDPLIKAKKWDAWNSAMGIDQGWLYNQGEGAVVAVIDTGISINHSDLVNNLWTNPGEIDNNEIDDDRNGYIDDVHGVSIIDGGSPSIYPDKGSPGGSDRGHGTHVAGIIAAELNGEGTNGLAPKASIMAIKIMNDQGEMLLVDVDRAIRYAVANGADIINLSLTSSVTTSGIQGAADAAENAGVLIVGASGNEGNNADKSRMFPAALDNDNLITVASASDSDQLSSFSNYGRQAVDLAAYGEGVPSTYPGNRYAAISGTSQAAPMISAEAALLASMSPAAGAAQWKRAIVGNLVKFKSLASTTRYGGLPDFPSALAWQADRAGLTQPLAPVRIRPLGYSATRRGSKFNLRLKLQMLGSGLGQIVKLKASAKGRSFYSSSPSSINLKGISAGSTKITVSAYDSSYRKRASKSFRLKIG
jgi:subtilisin family serine protease